VNGRLFRLSRDVTACSSHNKRFCFAEAVLQIETLEKYNRCSEDPLAEIELPPKLVDNCIAKAPSDTQVETENYRTICKEDVAELKVFRTIDELSVNCTSLNEGRTVDNPSLAVLDTSKPRHTY
jgi:hypothetical protein